MPQTPELPGSSLFRLEKEHQKEGLCHTWVTDLSPKIRFYNERLVLLVPGHPVPKLGKTQHRQVQSHWSLIRQKGYASHRVFFNKVLMGFHNGATVMADSFLSTFEDCFLYTGSVRNLSFTHTLLPSLALFSHFSWGILGSLPQDFILRSASGDHSKTDVHPIT